MLLVTWPASATENIQNNIHTAATENIDGVTYEVVNLSGNDTANLAKINTTANNNNYRYLLTADWSNASSTLLFGGNKIILDLNGYTLTLRSTISIDNCVSFEIADSSSAGTGVIQGGSPFIACTSGRPRTLTFSGGTCANGKMHLYDYVNVVFKGGSYANANLSDSQGLIWRENPNSQTISLSGGMVPAYSPQTGQLQSVTPGRVDDGLVYELVPLTNDNAANLAKFPEYSSTVATKNYYYVMTTDWQLANNYPIYGNAIIFDLNGYTYTRDTGNVMLSVASKFFELTDSSSAGTGTIVQSSKGNSVILSTDNSLKTQMVTISGGTWHKGKMHLYSGSIVFTGGTFINDDPEDSQGLIWRQNTTTQTMTIAPQLVTIYSANTGLLQSVRQDDRYTVSTTPYAAGVYNYAYGLAWEITGAELNNLSIPADKTYYLWGRNQDGWYEYLNIVYRDGAWVQA